MTQVPSLVMDWEFREGTTERVQELFIELGVITEFTEPVAEDRDRRPQLLPGRSRRGVERRREPVGRPSLSIHRPGWRNWQTLGA